MQQLYRIFIYIKEMEWDALARSKYNKWQFTTNLRLKSLTFWQNTPEHNNHVAYQVQTIVIVKEYLNER